jgi:hypothetical protein
MAASPVQIHLSLHENEAHPLHVGREDAFATYLADGEPAHDLRQPAFVQPVWHPR